MRIPSYRLHKPSGRAVVTLNERDHYLGPHGSPESRKAYNDLIAKWLAGGRVPLDNPGYSINQLILVYWPHAERYYVKHGKPTTTLASIKRTLRALRDFCGNEPAASFGPARFVAFRTSLIATGICRKTVQDYCLWAREVFRWGVEQELVPASVHQGLKAVKGLPKGRSAARETEPIKPVPTEHVEAVLTVARPSVAAMIRVQLYTGMRPGEIVSMRPVDLDRNSDVWAYTPAEHKTEHHGKSRRIAIGPRAQAILAPFLVSALADRPLFPFDGESRYRNHRTDYSIKNYADAVGIACQQADVPHWTPNRLRHNAATAIRARFDTDRARAALGHTSPTTTEIYAEEDWAKVAAVAREIG